jgi:ABC-type antimicrobial peptide transport system permease subunit
MMMTARLGPMLAAILGAFALVMTTVGAFGVFAYAVRQQRREIGIRMALGAPPAAVARLVLTVHMRTLAVGLGIGLLGSMAASALLQNRLHGLSPFDPIAYAMAALILLSCGVAATLAPVRRATATDPLETLREI